MHIWWHLHRTLYCQQESCRNPRMYHWLPLQKHLYLSRHPENIDIRVKVLIFYLLSAHPKFSLCCLSPWLYLPTCVNAFMYRETTAQTSFFVLVLSVSGNGVCSKSCWIKWAKGSMLIENRGMNKLRQAMSTLQRSNLKINTFPISIWLHYIHFFSESQLKNWVYDYCFIYFFATKWV